MSELHPVELGYLNGGADLATVVACTGLYRRGILARDADAAPGLAVDAERRFDAARIVARGMRRRGTIPRSRGRVSSEGLVSSYDQYAPGHDPGGFGGFG